MSELLLPCTADDSKNDTLESDPGSLFDDNICTPNTPNDGESMT